MTESRIKIETAPSTQNIKKDHSKNFIEPFSFSSFKFSIFLTCKSIARDGWYSAMKEACFRVLWDWLRTWTVPTVKSCFARLTASIVFSINFLEARANHRLSLHLMEHRAWKSLSRFWSSRCRWFFTVIPCSISCFNETCFSITLSQRESLFC